MSGGRHYDQDKESTVYVGNVEERVTDALMWELFMQMGPVINVHLPKDRVSQIHQGYGFVEFRGEEDADYACKILNNVRLHGKPIRVNKASADRRGPGGETVGGTQGVGAELFIGNLDPAADERTLYETFSRFGPLVATPKLARTEDGLSKGYGFVSYASFEASDDAIANMHGQYLQNKEVTVQYAYKKDGKGERHGDAAERALAAQAKLHGVEVNIPAMPANLVAPIAPTAPAYPQAQAPYYPPQTGTGSYASPHDRNNMMNMGPPSFGPSFGSQAYPPPMTNYGGPSPVYGGQVPSYGTPSYGSPMPPQQSPYAQPQYQTPNMMPPPSTAFPPPPPSGVGPPRSYNAPPPGAGLPQRPGSTNAGPGGPHRPNNHSQNGPNGATGRP